MSRGLALMMSVLIVGPLLLTAVPVALAVDDTAEIAGVWSGSGPGVISTPHDGTGGLAEFTLRPEPRRRRRCAADDLDFHDHSCRTGTANLAWALEGLHAWFAVTVGLRAIRDRGSPWARPPQRGPANCCTPPSNGFAYNGTADLDVRPATRSASRSRAATATSTRSCRARCGSRTNVVHNGSFEEPVVTTGGFDVVPTEVDHPELDGGLRRPRATQRHSTGTPVDA